MGEIRAWAYMLSTTAVFIGIVWIIIPKGATAKLLKLVTSTFFIIVITSPVVDFIDSGNFSGDMFQITSNSLYEETTQITSNILKEQVAQSLTQLISDELAKLDISSADIRVYLQSDLDMNIHIDRVILTMDIAYEYKEADIYNNIGKEMEIPLEINYR